MTRTLAILLTLALTSPAFAGGNTNGTDGPEPTIGTDDEGTGHGASTISCPAGEIEIDGYCFPDPDLGAGSGTPDGGSPRGGGGNSPGSGGGDDDDGGNIDWINCALRIGGAAMSWIACVGTAPAVATGAATVVPAAVCFGASLAGASAAKTCTGS